VLVVFVLFMLLVVRSHFLPLHYYHVIPLR
jgi:hypothetical protein